MIKEIRRGDWRWPAHIRDNDRLKAENERLEKENIAWMKSNKELRERRNMDERALVNQREKLRAALEKVTTLRAYYEQQTYESGQMDWKTCCEAQTKVARDALGGEQ